ncbi:hypothetical protein L9F63_021764, partial [Diploptera punctata]
QVNFYGSDAEDDYFSRSISMVLMLRMAILAAGSHAEDDYFSRSIPMVNFYAGRSLPMVLMLRMTILAVSEQIA